MSRLPFKLEATAPGTKARAARFTTLHGEVATPVFMPVGTQATVRGLVPAQVKAAGSQIILGNTYHLLLRPGIEVFRRFGGIHRFMGWDGPVLTDSGGFQIFSLPHARAMREEGADFVSYVDGKLVHLSPEVSIGMQRAIGSDIMMSLDQCVPSTADHATAKAAMELTSRWARRNLAARGDSPQALFGIVQGACHADLRKQSADDLASLPFDGLAIGGLAVGETKAERDDFTELTASFLPADRPRYLMGVGTPLDLLEAVHRGVDMFDCILPMSLGQRGVAFTSVGKLQLRRSVYKLAEEALDPACDCPTCSGWSRAYLHHLIKADEILGWQLLGLHNLHFFHRLTAAMRAEILAGSFADFYSRMRVELDRDDEEHPAKPMKAGRAPKAQRRSRLGDYEVVPSADGSWCSVRQISSGETMHSVSEPTEEARRLYVEQPDLAGLLINGDRPLVVWDVGLGAATNAMAALRCREALDAYARPLELVSFEIDLDPLRLAVRNAGRFPHLHHPGPAALLHSAAWECPGVARWSLLEGDFRERWREAPRPDLVYWDPFSAKADGPLWTHALFAELAAAWGQDTEASGGVRLITYSTSTAVRAALLAAGFRVAHGMPTGPKAETTLAWLPASGAREPDWPWLHIGWLARWERSGAPWPADIVAADPERRETFATAIRTHPQFAV